MRSIFLAASFMFTLSFFGKYNANSGVNVEDSKIYGSYMLEPVYIKAYNSTRNVVATIYNADPYQCDDTPLQTASLDWIDVDKLNSGELKWIAISWDMHKRYGGNFNFGDTIYVDSADEKIKGEWIVKDLMAPYWRNKIDFLMPVGYLNKYNDLQIKFNQ